MFKLEDGSEKAYIVDHKLYAAYLAICEANNKLCEGCEVLNQKEHDINARLVFIVEELQDLIPTILKKDDHF